MKFDTGLFFLLTVVQKVTREFPGNHCSHSRTSITGVTQYIPALFIFWTDLGEIL